MSWGLMKRSVILTGQDGRDAHEEGLKVLFDPALAVSGTFGPSNSLLLPSARADRRDRKSVV